MLCMRQFLALVRIVSECKQLEGAEILLLERVRIGQRW